MAVDITPPRLDRVDDPDVIARVVAILVAHRRHASSSPQMEREAA